MILTFGFIKLWMLEKLRFFQYKGFRPSNPPGSSKKKKRWSK